MHTIEGNYVLVICIGKYQLSIGSTSLREK